MNYLYIQTAFLGDLLLSVPALKQLRYIDSKSKITVLCRKGLGSFFMSLDVCDHVIEHDKNDKMNLHPELLSHYYDKVICAHQSLTTHKIVKKIKSKMKIGYKRPWNSLFFNERVERQLRWPEAIRQLQLLAPLSESIKLNIEAFSHKTESIPVWAQMNLPHLSFHDSDLSNLVEKKNKSFDLSLPYICIAPGSVWPTKRWIAEKFIKVASEFARKGKQVLVLGSPEERELCDKIQSQIPKSYNFAGQLTITESLKFLSKSQGLICNDSGAMHMASLFHLPTVSLFGPTVQQLGYKPWNPNAKVFENNKLLCRPCGQHGSRVCPIGTHQCMTSLDERVIYAESEKLFI